MNYMLQRNTNRCTAHCKAGGRGVDKLYFLVLNWLTCMLYWEGVPSRIDSLCADQLNSNCLSLVKGTFLHAQFSKGYFCVPISVPYLQPRAGKNSWLHCLSGSSTATINAIVIRTELSLVYWLCQFCFPKFKCFNGAKRNRKSQQQLDKRKSITVCVQLYRFKFIISCN